MRDTWRTKLLNVLMTALLAVIVGVGVVVIYPKWRRGEDLKRADAQLALQIAAKEREIKQLDENLKRFRSDPDFVEAIARQNRRVFPGELVFIFEDE